MEAIGGLVDIFLVKDLEVTVLISHHILMGLVNQECLLFLAKMMALLVLPKGPLLVVVHQVVLQIPQQRAQEALGLVYLLLLEMDNQEGLDLAV